MGDLGSVPGLGRSPGEGKGYPLQYSGLEDSIDCIVHGVAKSRTPLSDFHSLFIQGLCKGCTGFVLPVCQCAVFLTMFPDNFSTSVTL